MKFLKQLRLNGISLILNRGLVGGHCIGVDPYYLSYISRKYGYTPKVILSGRNTNDSMPKFYVNSIYEKLNINKSKRYSKKNFNFRSYF